MKKSQTTFAFAAITAAALALTACGGDSNSAEAGSANGGEGDLRTVNVGVLPITDVAPIYLGEEKGFFAEEGLQVEVQQVSGGAAAIPAVSSGDFDFAYSNPVSIVLANSQGLDISFISAGTANSQDEADASAILVPVGSDITEIIDLEGKTVSVNNLQSMGQAVVRDLVAEAGGDPDSIDFIEVPFPDVPSTIETGQIDAAWSVEPFISSISEETEVLSWLMKDFHPETNYGGYFTTDALIEEDPELIESFRTALAKSIAYSEENEEEVREMIGEYTSIEEELREIIVLPQFVSDFNIEATQKMADAAHESGFINEPLDVETLIHE